MVTPSPPGAVHIERYTGEGGRVFFPKILERKRHLPAAFPLKFHCCRRLLVTVVLLGIPLEQE
jgi:hypothetical protein